MLKNLKEKLEEAKSKLKRYKSSDDYMFFYNQIKLSVIHCREIDIKKKKKFLEMKVIGDTLKKVLENYLKKSKSTVIKSLIENDLIIVDKDLENKGKFLFELREIMSLYDRETLLSVEESESKYALERYKELIKRDVITDDKKDLLVDKRITEGQKLKGRRPSNGRSHELVDAGAQIATQVMKYEDPKRGLVNIKSESMLKGDLEKAIKLILAKETGLKNVFYVGSGAAAIEVALIDAMKKKPKAKKILAFEGSFHGRMLLSIQCTWNKKKREAFNDLKENIDFIKYPTITAGVEDKTEPSKWLNLWSKTELSKKDLKYINRLKRESKESAELIESLSSVDTLLKTGEYSSLIIEPMQCEGGERYASRAFYRALRLITKKYEVSLIIDEVQTGWGMCSELFWYKRMNFRDVKGNQLSPDYITVAKKLQIGAVISNSKDLNNNPTCLISLYRGYLNYCHWKKNPPKKTQNQVRYHFEEFKKVIGEEYIARPRGRGLAFSFDVPNELILAELLKLRFKYGVMFYQAGEKTIRLRFLAGISGNDAKEVFDRILKCFEELGRRRYYLPIEGAKRRPGNEEVDGFETEKRGNKFLVENLKRLTKEDSLLMLKEVLKISPEIVYSSEIKSLKELNRISEEHLMEKYRKGEITKDVLIFDICRKKSAEIYINEGEITSKEEKAIVEIEEEVYEESRRDPGHVYRTLSKKTGSIFFFAKSKEMITAKSVMAEYPRLCAHDLGIDMEGEGSSLYSMAISIRKKHQRQGLGLRLKIEQLIYAIKENYIGIISRNRIPEAQKMEELNHSLGAITVSHMKNSYNDGGGANIQRINIAGANAMKYCPRMIKGLRLNYSNFLSYEAVIMLNGISLSINRQHRHFYISSSKEESLEKVIKSFFIKNKKRPVLNICSSNILECFDKSTATVSGMIAGSLRREEGILREGINLISGRDLAGLDVLKISEEKTVVLYLENYHEYKEIKETEKMSYVSAIVFKDYGSFSLACMKRDVWIKTPLTMISTWDGDEYGMWKMLSEIEALNIS